MRLIRAMFLLMAVCLPTTWTLAHAAEEGAAGGGGGEMKEGKSKKKSKKKKGEGDMGDKKAEPEK